MIDEMEEKWGFPEAAGNNVNQSTQIFNTYQTFNIYEMSLQ